MNVNNIIKSFVSISVNIIGSSVLYSLLNDLISTGSKLDHKLNKLTERHADIFNSLKELINANYVNASDYDLYATKWFNKSNKVGLILH